MHVLGRKKLKQQSKNFMNNAIKVQSKLILYILNLAYPNPA
jgi:hypothetical protein